MNLVALAIPGFFAGIALELAVARGRGQKVYRFHDTLANLGCGIAQQATAIFVELPLLAAYVVLYDHRLITLPVWAQWVVGFFAIEIAYYWWHRVSHRVNLFWAAHITHHQSEEMNLAVALRQSAFTKLTFVPFLVALPFIGVPPVVYAVVYAINLLYQFWIHTELIPRLGWFEHIFNTPSHHRVHHAINPQYLDKNYGGILIVWDRLFGSFSVEQERCRYGITKRLGSFNPIWAQVHYWRDLWRNGLWRTMWDEPAAVKIPDRAIPDPRPLSRGEIALTTTLLVATTSGTIALLMFHPRWPLWIDLAVAAAMIGLLGWMGVLLDASSARADRAAPRSHRVAVPEDSRRARSG